MIDMQALLLDPVYDAWGLPAVITTKTGQVLICLVLDHRKGFQLTGGYGGQSTFIPGKTTEDAGLLVRHSQCPEKPSGGTIVVNGEADTYRIRNTALVGTRDTGEWALMLE